MILRNMQDHSSALVQQAIMVSEELIRVAILWHEQWHEGLEDASRWAEGVGGCGREGGGGHCVTMSNDTIKGWKGLVWFWSTRFCG